MAEPERIADYVTAQMSGMKKDLKGKRVLVTAGPTIEDIDPVRFISNRSSGKMGYAVAEAALARGADVTLISGPVSISCPEGVKIINVRSTQDMLDACLKVYEDIDVVIKAAAPADFCMGNKSEHKIKKKDDEDNLKLVLKKTPDILASLGAIKEERLLVGFAAETREPEKYAREKMRRKNLDIIVANNVAASGAGFNCDTNIITIIKAKDEAIKKSTQIGRASCRERV